MNMRNSIALMVCATVVCVTVTCSRTVACGTPKTPAGTHPASAGVADAKGHPTASRPA
jgi:hypothetical protein